MYRVKFYSTVDYSSGFSLRRAKEIIDEFDIDKRDYNINEIIEFYNITKFIDNRLYLKSWSEKDIENMNKVVNKYKRIITCHFKKVCSTNLIGSYNIVNSNYTDDFFEIIDKYKLFQNISNDIFNDLITNCKVNILDILYNKQLTYYFEKIIREKLIKNSKYAEILLQEYELKDSYIKRKIYFPLSFTLEDKESMILEYIRSDFPNLNYLNIINNAQNSNNLRISDKTKLESKKRTEEENKKFFSMHTGMPFGAEVSFSKEQIDEIQQIEKDGIVKCSYSMNWIKNNRDYNTLLNNFIYLFGYTDLQMRIALVSKLDDLGLFEKTLTMHSKHEYLIGVAFEVKKMLSTLQITGYYERLADLNIRLEEIIEWFFKKYLLDEFNIEDYRINMPSKDSTYLEKCRSVLPEFEAILKQYNLLVEDGKINHELLQISSNHMFVKNIKSLLQKKYIYPNLHSEQYQRLNYCLFSDQCMLSYIERLNGKPYKNFYKLLLNEKDITLKDIEEYNKTDIDFLIENNYVEVNNNTISFTNWKIINILNDISRNEVISYWKYPLSYREEMDKLCNDNILKFDSSLFSKPEQDYFNYYLNKSSFNNSLDLRNTYLHGSQSNISSDEQIHYINYMVFLKLFTLTIIKINDDICTYYDIKDKNKK